jgi:hypothetical protein
MRISLPGSTGTASSQLRPQGNIALYYNASGVGTHSETIRSSYTVPSGKFAVVDYAFIRVRCSAGLNEYYKVSARVKVAYAGGTDTVVFEVSEIIALTETHKTDHGRLGLVLMPGDVIKITTHNPTSFSSYDYLIFVSMTLYNL